MPGNEQVVIDDIFESRDLVERFPELFWDWLSNAEFEYDGDGDPHELEEPSLTCGLTGQRFSVWDNTIVYCTVLRACDIAGFCIEPDIEEILPYIVQDVRGCRWILEADDFSHIRKMVMSSQHPHKTPLLRLVEAFGQWEGKGSNVDLFALIGQAGGINAQSLCKILADEGYLEGRSLRGMPYGKTKKKITRRVLLAAYLKMGLHRDYIREWLET